MINLGPLKEGTDWKQKSGNKSVSVFDIRWNLMNFHFPHVRNDHSLKRRRSFSIGLLDVSMDLAVQAVNHMEDIEHEEHSKFYFKE